MPVAKVNIHSGERLVVGSSTNFWMWSQEAGWDLTHAPHPTAEPANGRVHLDCEVSNIIIDPAKTALTIIDMQNITLSRSLNGEISPALFKAQDQLVKYGIPAARALGIQVIWLNWGLTENGLENISPAEPRVFAFKAHSDRADYGMSERKRDPTNPDNFLKCGE